MPKDVIIALDFPTAEKALAFLTAFKGHSPYVKIGMELFYAAGPDIVRAVKAQGFKVFLDLKLHDIPNTVKGGMASLRGLGVDMCNLHAGGGRPMMEAALEGLSVAPGPRPILLAVTQLTSTSQEVMERDLLINRPLEDVVTHYAGTAKAAGLDGVVCSPLESPLVKAACGDMFLTVTPGVRFAEGDVQDQARVTTPEKARLLGSDYIVVGRPITQASDPVAAWQRCISAFIG